MNRSPVGMEVSDLVVSVTVCSMRLCIIMLAALRTSSKKFACAEPSVYAASACSTVMHFSGHHGSSSALCSSGRCVTHA